MMKFKLSQLQRDKYAKKSLQGSQMCVGVNDIDYKSISVVDSLDFLVKSNPLYPADISKNKSYYKVSGIANKYNIEDQADDVIASNTFKEDIKTNGSIRPLLFNHNADAPLGLVDVKETKDALLATAYLPKGNPKVEELIDFIEMGVVKAFSVGFRILADTVEREGADSSTADWIRTITKGKLYEVSLVCFPCNEESVVTETVEENNEDDSGITETSKGLTIEEEIEKLFEIYNKNKSLK